VSFFTIREYEIWASTQPNVSLYKIKYYKGLGTSTAAEAKEYFSNIGKHRITFRYVDLEDDESIHLAFSKDKADSRKEWLSRYN
jgi:DNA topoisomerase-2